MGCIVFTSWFTSITCSASLCYGVRPEAVKLLSNHGYTLVLMNSTANLREEYCVMCSYSVSETLEPCSPTVGLFLAPLSVWLHVSCLVRLLQLSPHVSLKNIGCTESQGGQKWWLLFKWKLFADQASGENTCKSGAHIRRREENATQNIHVICPHRLSIHSQVRVLFSIVSTTALHSVFVALFFISE